MSEITITYLDASGVVQTAHEGDEIPLGATITIVSIEYDIPFAGDAQAASSDMWDGTLDFTAAGDEYHWPADDNP